MVGCLSECITSDSNDVNNVDQKVLLACERVFKSSDDGVTVLDGEGIVDRTEG